MRDKFNSSNAYRKAFTTCLTESFGVSIGESIASQITKIDLTTAIKTLGNIGVRTTVPGLLYTSITCPIQAEMDT